MAFPSIDPVAFRLGPLEIKWYALAYVAGLLFAVAYMKRLVRTPRLWDEGSPPPSPGQIDDLFIWATLGVVLGGRLGYVLFYDPSYFLRQPLAIARLWQGGMSFHGGFAGVIAACWLHSRNTGVRLDRWLDLAAAAVPMGLGLGRVANFINGELYGRVSSVPWAVVFPDGGPLPRHPSQLYEAALEGMGLFLACRIASHRFRALAYPGRVAGIFTLGYGMARMGVELFREPDAQIGIAAGFLTRGMLLCLPMMVVGGWLIIRSRSVER
ncbi:MAG: prolipoprotein diacylglyceryl transferase [Pseudomonadota bacterium]|nr:prolipoprotein diacylglyceryl transferase [Pseudomonadota bacterium]